MEIQNGELWGPSNALLIKKRQPCGWDAENVRMLVTDARI